MTAPLVMIVDDNVDLLFILNRKLTRAGFIVETFVDGMTFFTRIARHPRPAAVIVDVMMPGVSGLEVLTEIRAGELASVPVALLSAASNISNRLDGYAHHADTFFPKTPLGYSALITWCRQVTGV